jgi:LPXTG-site transpeptidase (sortase) family protein
MRRASLAGVLAAVLITVGAGTLAYPGLAYGTSSLRQARLAAEARTLRGVMTAQPRVSVANVVAFRPSDGQPLGVIRIPRINLEAVFFEGVKEETFLSGPGHLPWTALPGSTGTSVLAAHRDMHFRDLKELRRGDRLVLNLPDRSVRYRVSGRAIADPDDAWVTKPGSDPILRLVTCWPPAFIGPAPERLVVSAIPVGRTAPEPPATPAVARTISLQTRDQNPLAPSSLPLAGAAGAGAAALSAFAAIRWKQYTWGFLGWVAGVGVVVLTLLAAWAGPGLEVRWTQGASYT